MADVRDIMKVFKNLPFNYFLNIPLFSYKIISLICGSRSVDHSISPVLGESVLHIKHLYRRHQGDSLLDKVIYTSVFYNHKEASGL